ncbi:hypothetical protein BH10ACT1_BH10ACT1_35350 [soil metagenome]
MSDAVAPSAEPTVVVPAGLPILEAAAWVGHACWAELRLHETLTRWLAVEADPPVAVALWTVRAHRAELAESWHRRLPELRELPREQFVRSSSEADAGFEVLDALTAPEAGAARVDALAEALRRMGDHYEAHVDVATGPADGPTADALRQSIARTRSDLALLE